MADGGCMVLCQCCCKNGNGVGPSSGGSLRRQFLGAMLSLAVFFSGLYLLLYYRATLLMPSFLLVSRGGPAEESASNSFLEFSTLDDSAVTIDSSKSVLNKRWNATEWQTLENLRNSIVNGSSAPLLTLFTTWLDRADLELVHNITLRNWAQLYPFVIPVLFTNSTSMAQTAIRWGWHVLPVSRVAVGVPILKNMYLDAMDNFNSTLYAFANGDILFTLSLVDTLLAVLRSPFLPLDSRPPFIVGIRINVPMVSENESAHFDDVTKVARDRGKPFITMAEDYFITDRRFPWESIPGVVIGRAAYDNWLVLHAIQHQHIVVDASKTLLAVHQTTRAGNHEGFSHTHSSYNSNMLKSLYKRIHYQGGCVDCAPWRTLKTKSGKIYVEEVSSKPKHCR